MKVAHLVISGDVAGGQLVALRLLRAVRARGDDAIVIAPSPGPFVDTVRAEGVPVHFVDVGRTFRLVAAWRLKRLLERERVDVLHTHTALAANVLSRLAGRAARVPVISHMHIENHFRPQRLLRAFHQTLDNLTARLCARILVVSEHTRRALEDQGFPRELMETVYNGIDVEEVAARRAPGIRAELGIPADAPLIGSIGRLCAVKGQRELIHACARLSDRYPDLRLLLVGEDIEAQGTYRAFLEKEAKHLGLGGRVVFGGYRPDADALLAEFDVFVLPSWIEGLPLVVLEAMAQKTPVVATPVGGTPEVVNDGETGLLVPPRDPDALADTIRALLDDPERARRMGEAGYTRVSSLFVAGEMATRVLAVYDAIADGGAVG